MIYERDSFITGEGQPKRAIWEKRQINLSSLAGAPLLQAGFDHYQLGWMNKPKVYIARQLCGSSITLL